MAFEARALLNEANRLERASRGSQRTVSIPVLGFGAAGALLNGVHGEMGSWGWGGLAIIVAAGSLFLVVAALGWRARRVGVVGRRAAAATAMALTLPLFAAVFIPLPTPMPSAYVALGLALSAAVRRNWLLLRWMLVLGPVAVLLDTHFWTNRLHQFERWRSGDSHPLSGYESYHHLMATALIVGLIVAVGLWAPRRERSA